MIDAIKKRSENMEKLREEHPKTWMELLTYFEIKMMFKDRTDLVTETTRLLERAEAEAREAVAREAMVLTALRNLHSALMPYTESVSHGTSYCKFCYQDQGEWVQGDARWKPVHHEECPIGQAISVLRNPSEATAALAENNAADLRGALQAALEAEESNGT